ncbi:MAG: tetratricopeptide repeat protein [Arenicellales bacterium]|nr:tetratricopeptide repeat protein [Arenicellales bacterium]
MIDGVVTADSSYVGVTACTQCHADQVQAWRGSHHDLAMQKATEATVLGDFNNAEFTHFGVTSRFYTEGERFYVNTEGPDGRLADFEIKYTFGIHPLQQYLVEFDGGRLQALSVAWDSRPQELGGQKWFHLYPDEQITPDDSLHWTGLNQNWNYMCAECHSTNLRRNYDPKSNTYDTTWSELNVACEACHGPALKHVEWAKEADREEKNAYGLIVDISRSGQWLIDEQTGIAKNLSRSSSQQIETCARCHSRRIVLSEEYQHGRPLINTYRPQILLEDLYHADGQIQDEVYVYGSFVQSKMFEKGVICTDCHDPHTLELKAQGNALCNRCHLADKFDSPEHHFHQQGGEAAQCVACHMPARLYMVNDSRRDHSFRVPRPDLSEQMNAPDVCTDCHHGRRAKWAADVIRDRTDRNNRPVHYGVAIQAGRSGSLDAETQLIRLAQNPELPGIVRATGATLLGNYLSPLSIQTIAGLLQDKDPLVRVNAVSALEGLEPKLRLRLASGLLDDPETAVKIEAANLLADVPGELMNSNQRLAFGEAIDAYIEVQENNADRPESWTNLGNLYLRLGNAEKAMLQYEHAIDLDPAYTPAYVNLADSYRSQKQDAEAERVLVEAIAEMPEQASLRHSYALLLIRQNKLKQAMKELKRAVELDPRNVRFRYVYGVALSSVGDLNNAITELESANAIYPADRDVLVALVNFHQQNGDLASARRYAQDLVTRAPWDRNAKALLKRLAK